MIIILILILLIFFFIWVLRNNKRFFSENFAQYLWMPTRNTRLMSYDLRGDPYGMVVYPSYYSYNAPFATYLYRSDRYGIDGKYYVVGKQPLYEKDNKKRIFFHQSPWISGKYLFRTRRAS